MEGTTRCQSAQGQGCCFCGGVVLWIERKDYVAQTRGGTVSSRTHAMRHNPPAVTDATTQFFTKGTGLNTGV